MTRKISLINNHKYLFKITRPLYFFEVKSGSICLEHVFFWVQNQLQGSFQGANTFPRICSPKKLTFYVDLVQAESSKGTRYPDTPLDLVAWWVCQPCLYPRFGNSRELGLHTTFTRACIFIIQVEYGSSAISSAQPEKYFLRSSSTC